MATFLIIIRCFVARQQEGVEGTSAMRLTTGADLGGFGFEVGLERLALEVDLQRPVGGGDAVARGAGPAQLGSARVQRPAGTITVHGERIPGGGPIRDCSSR